jgi:CRP/FNR family transcriptional regulator, cyclic AMP receptor protein
MRSNLRGSHSAGPLLQYLGHAGTSVKFRRRQVIFAVGDRSDSLFLIERGSVKLTVNSEEGREAVIAVLGQGSFFGESALATKRFDRSVNAIALTDVRTARIARDSVLHLLHAGGACEDLVSCLVELISQRSDDLANTLLYSSERRLARALLAMSRLSQQEDDHRIPRVSQQDLANMVGITRQRVNVLIKRFHKLGFIDHSTDLKVYRSITTAAGKDLICKPER